jgi:hypothetical protein
MKITEHADGTKTLEGTAEELAAYYAKAMPFRFVPCPMPHYPAMPILPVIPTWPVWPPVNPWPDIVWTVPHTTSDRITIEPSMATATTIRLHGLAD